MATVYVATDLRLERRIALKVMHGHLSDDTVFQSRFIQEARAAARLADPHVVNVFDQGQDGDMAYLVMEYLPGITLRELLREQRRLTVPQTVTIMDAILSGLAAAHRAGIVHRDVKPENVLLAEDGRIKIGDFGLARATTANTATGAQLLGTIAYLAPELVTRGMADARSDILWVIVCAANPGESVGTTKPRMPPSSSPALAQTTATSAIEPLVIHVLAPSSTQSSPSRRALVRIDAGSEPWSGSVRPKQPIASPAAIRGSHSCFCSSLPQRWMANIASDPCTDTRLRRPESAASSSRHARP